MKKVNVLTALLSLLVLLASCVGPVMGAGDTLTLKVTLGQGGGGRTVVPDLAGAVKSYRLSLTSQNGLAPREVTSDEGQITVELLRTGTWNLTGQALDAAGIVVAEKSLVGQVMAASGTLELTLALEPTVRSGTGSLDLTLEWPESTGVDGLTVSLLTGETSVAEPLPAVTLAPLVTGSPRTARITRSALASGTYALVLNFSRAGVASGTFREALNITADLTTRLWINPADGKLVDRRTFTAGDFLGAQTSLAGLVVSGVLAPDFIFKSETTSYTIPQVPTAGPLTFTATQGMPGQNLEYQWNSEGSWQTGVFGVLSRPLTLKAGTNNLTLKVTAPDRTNFKTYTLTLHWTPSFVSLTGMEMVQVDGGTFQRDAVATNLSTVDSFLLGRYEVTQAQWLEVMGNNPSFHVNKLLHPAENMSWYATLVFCNRLSLKEGLTPVYSINNSTNPDAWGALPSTNNPVWNDAVFNPSANGYRLPTVDEWRWAAMGGLRDGQPGNFMGGINTGGYDKPFAGFNGIGTLEEFDKYVWHTLNSSNSTRPVGEKLPNELGIYDLSGNVWEILWNWNYAHNNLYLQGALRNSQGYSKAVTYRSDLGASFDTSFSSQSEFFHIYTALPNGAILPTQVTKNTGLRVARNTSPLQKLTYNTNGSSSDMSFTEAYPTGAATKIVGNASSAIPPAGKVFNRWSEWVNGTADDYLPGQSYTMPGSDKTLYAQWTDPGAAVKARIIQSGTGASTVEDLAVDGEGNVYAVGMIYGTSLFDFGNGVKASAGNSENNAYLAKFNKFGQVQWVFYPKTAQGSSQFNAVAVDEAGRIYAGGWQSGGKFVYQSNEAYELESLSGTRNATLFCLDSKGQVLWGSSAQKGAQEELLQSEILDLKVYKEQLFAVGYQESYYDGNKLTIIPYHYGTAKSANPVSFPFKKAGVLLSLEATTGTFSWGRGLSFGSETGQYEYSAVSVDESGIYVAGNYWSNLDYSFNGGNIVPGYNGEENALLAKYTLIGVESWIVYPGEHPGKSRFTDVHVQGSHVYVVGYQFGNSQFLYQPSSTPFTAGAAGVLNAVLFAVEVNYGGVDYAGGAKDTNRSEFHRIHPGTDGKSLFVSGNQPPGGSITKNYLTEGSITIPGSGAGYESAGFIAKVSVEVPTSPKVISSRFFASDNSYNYFIHALTVDPEGSVYAGALLDVSAANAVFKAGAGVSVTKTFAENVNGMVIKYLP